MQSNGLDQIKAAGVVFAGGLLALVAPFFGWVEFAPQGSSAATFQGTETTAGKGSMGFALGMLVAGMFLWLRGSKTSGKGSAIVAIVFAGFIAFAGGMSAVAPAEAVATFESSTVAEEYNIPEDVAKQAIKDAIDAGNVDVSALGGAWIAFSGGLVGIAGGIFGIGRSREIRNASMPVSAPNPSAAEPPFP
jgi:hypothetical protein